VALILHVWLVITNKGIDSLHIKQSRPGDLGSVSEIILDVLNVPT